MKMWRYLWLAIRLWNVQRLQAILSASGIAIGVAGFVVVIAMSQGAREELARITDLLGTSTLVIRSTNDERSLTLAQLERLQHLLGPQLLAAAPLARQWAAIGAGALRDRTRIVATSADYRKIHNLSMRQGRFLSALDMHRQQRVCVLGPGIAEKLFPAGNAAGATLYIGQELYRVVGVLSGSHLSGNSLDAYGLPQLEQAILVPLTTFANRPAETIDFEQMLVKMARDDLILPALPVLQRFLGKQHFEEDSLELIIPLERLQRKRHWQRTLEYLLFGISAIVLGIGTAGMANVMLVSVNTRRREIGLRRALGATRKHILQQFMAEGLVLAAAGGIAGTALGWALGRLLQVSFDMAIRFDVAGSAAALLIALLAGVLSSAYPARKAANTRPVDALRQP